MTDKTARNFALVTRKLGFIPWGCDECRNLAHCRKNEHHLPTLPCELEDIEAGVDPHKPPRKSTWDTFVEAA